MLTGVSPTLLGKTRASGLTVVVTVATIFGFGLASPIEQVISRRLNVGNSSGARQPLLWLTTASGAAVVAAVVAGPHLPAHKVFSALVPGMVLAALGWLALVSVRCRLAGAGDLTAYAVVLVSEATARCALVAAAIVDRGDEVLLLSLAVGVPLLLAAGIGAVVQRPALVPGQDDQAQAAGVAAAEQLSFIAVSVGYQICLNTLPLFLDLKQAALVAPAGFANSYFLAPTVAMGGITTHALVTLSQAWGERDFATFRTARRQAQRNGALVAVGVTGVASALAPFILPLPFDGHLGLPFALLAAMALSTVITVVAAVAMQPLLAAGHGRTAALSWIAGAVVTVSLIGLSSGTSWLTDVGLLAGPGVALAGALWSVSRMLRHWSDQGATTTPLARTANGTA